MSSGTRAIEYLGGAAAVGLAGWAIYELWQGGGGGNKPPNIPILPPPGCITKCPANQCVISTDPNTGCVTCGICCQNSDGTYNFDPYAGDQGLGDWILYGPCQGKNDILKPLALQQTPNGPLLVNNLDMDAVVGHFLDNTATGPFVAGYFAGIPGKKPDEIPVEMKSNPNVGCVLALSQFYYQISLKYGKTPEDGASYWAKSMETVGLPSPNPLYNANSGGTPLMENMNPLFHANEAGKLCIARKLLCLANTFSVYIGAGDTQPTTQPCQCANLSGTWYTCGDIATGIVMSGDPCGNGDLMKNPNAASDPSQSPWLGCQTVGGLTVPWSKPDMSAGFGPSGNTVGYTCDASPNIPATWDNNGPNIGLSIGDSWHITRQVVLKAAADYPAREYPWIIGSLGDNGPGYPWAAYVNNQKGSNGTSTFPPSYIGQWQPVQSGFVTAFGNYPTSYSGPGLPPPQTIGPQTVVDWQTEDMDLYNFGRGMEFSVQVVNQGAPGPVKNGIPSMGVPGIYVGPLNNT